MTCAHCSVESSPKLRGQPQPEELLERIEQAAAAGVTQVLLTGGEPMMRYEVCLQLLERARQLGIRPLLVSNGFWGKQAAEANRKLRALIEAGLTRLSLSYDRYHHEFQGAEPLTHIVQAARELDFPVDIVVTRNRDDEDLESFIQPFRGAPNVQFRFYDLQAVGAARQLDTARMRAEMEGHCSACAFPALTDDGRLTACNGPAYFSPTTSPLQVGNLSDKPLSDLLEKHRQDVVLETIRTQGPLQLQRELLAIPGFQDYPFKADYSGICELCLQITSDPRAVEALRQHLGNEDSRAQREAIRLVTQASRSGGRFHRENVNTSGIVQLLIQLRSRPFAEDAETILGRADLDWPNLLERVTRANLAGPLLQFEAHWQRWAPRFFVDGLYQQAAREELRANLRQAELLKLDQELLARGETAVLTPQDRLWRPTSEPLFAGHWRFPHSELLARTRSLPGFQAIRGLCLEGQLLTTAWECSLGLFSDGLRAAWDVNSIGPADLELVNRWAKQSAAPRACWVPLQALGLSGFSAPEDRRQKFLLQVARRRLFARQVHPLSADPWVRTAGWLLLHEHFGGQVACLLACLPRLWRHSPSRLIAFVRSRR
jgi:pyruvate-formate lyase-activating enzyme